mmetsp:Transcript_7319/g.8397  ORF Transcript_7319/g.8397 Transcript_7319/m.8397 type:complete len:502 (-) Transcript_7319:104-1609(-)
METKTDERMLQFPENQFDDGFFNIGRKNGFLPKFDPAPCVSSQFSPLQDILEQMPVYLSVENKEKGLLGTPGAIVKAVANLPNFSTTVEELDTSCEEDMRQLQVLFRAYAFLSSAYLLEKAYHSQSADGTYGRARNKLPVQLAVPFALVAEKLEQQPFLEYHYAYSLGNYIKIDPKRGFHWSNLKMACCFSGKKDEQGFIMLHVTINSFSGPLIGGISDSLAGARKNDSKLLCSGLADATFAMRKINAIRRQMWVASKPENYNDFRVFIMGVAGNKSIFGDGVIYEGVEKYKGEPQTPRGQTGAQDDIIPTCDIFSGVTNFYPKNKLTEYLYDLRNYRPKVVQEFFTELQNQVQALNFHEHVKQNQEAIGWMIKFVQEIFLFRNGHWQFVQRYILQQTRHECATGGTPITSWLPNQLEAVLNQIDELLLRIRKDKEISKEIEEVRMNQGVRRDVLQRQLEELRKAEYDSKKVYKINPKGHVDEELGQAEAKESEDLKCPFH